MMANRFMFPSLLGACILMRHRTHSFPRALRRVRINYYNLAMGNVTDGTILTFGIRSQNSTEIARRQRAVIWDRPAQIVNRQSTLCATTTSRHSDNLIPIPSLLADQPYNTKATDKSAGTATTLSYFRVEASVLRRGRNVAMLNQRRLLFSPLWRERMQRPN
jgi:hypothetical protein